MLLYNLFLLLYRIGLRIAALFNAKAAAFLAGRREQAPRWENLFAHEDSPIAWFHCASVGEFEQGRTLIEQFRQRYPKYKVLLTFFSPSGYQLHQRYEHANWVLYLPLDSPKQAQRIVALVKPAIVFFVRYEFWYYYLRELHRRNIPVILFSAVFRRQQLFFKPYGGFYRQMLHYFREIHVQNESSRHLLAGIGVRQVHVSGDTRIDRVAYIAETAAPVSIAAHFAYGNNTIVIGSLWSEDWHIIQQDVKQLLGWCKFIIAPHEISEKLLQRIEQDCKLFKTLRYSQVTSHLDENLYGARCLLIDNIGMLNRLYIYGNLAYVGGAFGNGLHNILEPAAFGVPVVFGNRNYSQFPEAVELLAKGGAFIIARPGEFTQIVKQLLTHKQAWQHASEACSAYIQRNKGATKKILTSISKYLDFKQH
ncbi:MAG: glycosyltransferase N-terminal domain-containing protein [Cytophagales bacterium]|nr:3-deoxy-D-manno-octulosonic acid transferase [Bernardetiaceae bacterium]MDW8211152.1 glycosyltransferase N-terminal domain-containing protein [Cytophagales bacterium]